MGFPDGLVVKNLPTMQEMQVQPLGQGDPLEKEMATHTIILAQRIPWTEEPDKLQPLGSQRVGHNSVHKHTYAQLYVNIDWNVEYHDIKKC